MTQREEEEEVIVSLYAMRMLIEVQSPRNVRKFAAQSCLHIILRQISAGILFFEVFCEMKSTTESGLCVLHKDLSFGRS